MLKIVWRGYHGERLELVVIFGITNYSTHWYDYHIDDLYHPQLNIGINNYYFIYSYISLF